MKQILKIINYYLPLFDFLYILQLEEYELKRYLKQIPPRIVKRNFAVRDQLRYTWRIKLTILVLSLLVLLFMLTVHKNTALIFIYVVALPFITPYLIAVASLLLDAPLFVAKRYVIRSARSVFKAEYHNTKIIAVTGSFGKTTVKYLLEAVLQYDFKVAIIPDNINTALGIASVVRSRRIPKDTEYLIVEMGAYERGDIAASTALLAPDIAVLTALGDQHLERFGGQRELIQGKAEIYTTTTPAPLCYTTKDAQIKLITEKLLTEKVIAVDTDHYDSTNHALAAKVALDLGVKADSITDSFTKFTPPNRRKRVYEHDGVTVIDDSYNISPITATNSLTKAHALAEKENKKLVVMTGGIGEQAPHEHEVNSHFGSELSNVAERVILNPTIYHESILRSLSIPHTIVKINSDVRDNPSAYVDGDTEILLFLTGHADLAYL